MISEVYTVLTTIHDPDDRIMDWMKITGNKTIVVGDKKTPSHWNHESCNFVDLEAQKHSSFITAKLLPENHYVRKNLGYLLAIKNGAKEIIDTDDDNFPFIEKWQELLKNDFNKIQLCEKSDFTFKNIYTYFADAQIPFWPRGFPLDLIQKSNSFISNEDYSTQSFPKVGLWQCMVDGEPDVDAIHRLLYANTPKFFNNDALIFGGNNFCSFNSQNTLWTDRELFPLLYLPSTVSFRFTDILRSYIAQVVINVSNKSWGFYPSTSYQERNLHNLMQDFNSETSMYQNMLSIFSVLYKSVSSNLSIIENLINCYHSLANKGYVESNEIEILKHWISDISFLLDI